MSQIPPIEDAYIDEIIKAQDAYNPSLNKTQGIKLRELIKKLRDRLEQEIAEAASANVEDATVLVKGKIKLAGDLGGTADVPTVPGLSGKVDKINGKGLSTEDYTTTEKKRSYLEFKQEQQQTELMMQLIFY
ncbi:hypothetical protein [Pedobacter sp. NJ-S-72]